MQILAHIRLKKWQVIVGGCHFGAQTPELQHIAVRVLSQVTSARSCERNWSTSDFIHSKKRNRLACPTVRNIVTVHFNLRLVDRIEELGHCDDDIDWSSKF